MIASVILSTVFAPGDESMMAKAESREQGAGGTFELIFSPFRVKA